MARTRPAVKLRTVASGPGSVTPFPSGVSPTEILGHVLKLYNRLLVPFSAHLEKRHKIGLNEFRMLMMIGRLGTTASHEVAELTGVNTMAISRAVALLQKHRRIEVTTDPNNRRRKTLRLTASGARSMSRCCLRLKKWGGICSKRCGRTRSWRSIGS